uniref:ADP-ribosyl cyclase/cyclic ADP-ribose hydrolase 1 n=1 Tax=Rousettus aegyptiacus TaxID=9407 RepID=A0A7J8E5V2_ROUAE|nr:CD38 molecule [Rousettus aegyptiacus]
MDHGLRPADPAVDPGPSRGSQMEEEEEEEGESWCTMSKKVKISVIVVLCALVLAAVALGVVFGVLKLHQTRQLKKWHGEGTTPHFHKKLLKRCYDYTQVLKPELRSAKDCQKIVEAFMDAVLSKDPCRSTEEDYEPLMKLTDQTVPCDKTLFWSGTGELVHQYIKSQPEMFTLENTLLGYMADGLKWCGDAGSSGEGLGCSGPSRGTWGAGALSSAKKQVSVEGRAPGATCR